MFDNKKAQALVEFALIAPILIMLLLMITEFGYILNVRNTLSEATKDALAQTNSKFNNITGATTAVKRANVENELQASITDYLRKRAVPNPSSVYVYIYTDPNGISTVRTSYSYRLAMSAFAVLLPGPSGAPTITLETSQIINSAIVHVNNFNSGLTTQQLSSFFPTPSSSLNTNIVFNATSLENLKWHTALLVSWYDDDDLSYVSNADYASDSTHFDKPVYARLYNWYGQDLLPANERIDLRTATIQVRSPYYNGGDWLDTKIPYVWVLAALDYTEVYYTKYNSTVDINASGLGWTLNECSTNNYYWATDECPIKWSGTTYPYLYRIYPIVYSQTNHDLFMQSFGYRWCSATGVNNTTGAQARCNSDQIGSHTAQELALKGFTRDGVYSSANGLDYSYNKRGNYEYVNNLGATNINSLQHYTVQSRDTSGNFDGNYIINIFQPIASYYFTSETEPVDPAKIDNTNGPFYKAFQWKFTLNGLGQMTSGVGGSNLIDVYIDTDGDGIPDAWDNKPTYFDADANGVLDGYQMSLGSFNSSGSLINQFSSVGTGDYTYPVPGVNQTSGGYNVGPPISTPFLFYGPFCDTRKTVATKKSLIADSVLSQFKTNSGKLYVQCDTGSGTYNDLCRFYPTWGSSGAGALTIMQQKERFINGHICGSDICLDKSSEMTYLDNNNFVATNKVTRTPHLPLGW